MRAYLRPLIVHALFCSLICYPISIGFGQTKSLASSDPWMIVQSIPYATELEVQLNDGQKLNGRLLAVSDTTLRISRKREIAEVNRDDIRKIYQLFTKSDEFRRMARNLGAITGASTGLEIVKDQGFGYFLLPALGGTFGAFGGYAVSKRMKSRMLIYDAQPQQLSCSENSAKR